MPIIKRNKNIKETSAGIGAIGNIDLSFDANAPSGSYQPGKAPLDANGFNPNFQLSQTQADGSQTQTNAVNNNANPGGGYNAAKGGYVDASGKLYPTTNPNFIPGQLGNTPINGGYSSSADRKKFEAYDSAVQQQQQQQAQAQQSNDLMAQVGQPGQMEDISPTALDTREIVGQAAGQGLIGGIGAAAGSAALAGAVAGTAVAPGIGTVIVGALGLAAGIARAVYTNIKQQKNDNISQQKKVYTDGNRQLSRLVALTKADKRPEKQAEYIAAFNQQLTNMKQAHSKMILDTQNDLFKFNDARTELQAFENFYASGGGYDFYTQKMQMVLSDPNADINDLNMVATELENE